MRGDQAPKTLYQVVADLPDPLMLEIHTREIIVAVG